MNKNELIVKAKMLDEQHKADEVVALLEDYVKEYTDDKDAVALYHKNLVVKTILDLGLNVDELYATDAANIFNNVPEEKALKLSEFLLAEAMASLYLRETVDDKLENLLFGYLHRAISSLGERLNDYDVFQKQMEKYHDLYEYYGFDKNFYYHLSIMVNWKSKISENILLLLVEKAKNEIKIVPDKTIYDDYVNGINSPIFSYDDRPALNGDRLVVTNIKTEQARDFWKGFFALVKEIRQKEYDTYVEATTNKDHKLHDVYMIGEYIHDSYMNALMRKTASSEEVAKMQVSTKCHTVNVSESEFVSRLNKAEQSFNTVQINLIDQIKILIKKMLGKQ